MNYAYPGQTALTRMPWLAYVDESDFTSPKTADMLVSKQSSIMKIYEWEAFCRKVGNESYI